MAKKKVVITDQNYKEIKFDYTRVNAALKKSTKVELLQVILAALDCQGHFHKPKIVWKDKYFTPGPNPQVICTQCVNRMREVLALGDDPVPPSFGYFGALLPPE